MILDFAPTTLECNNNLLMCIITHVQASCQFIGFKLSFWTFNFLPFIYQWKKSSFLLSCFSVYKLFWSSRNKFAIFYYMFYLENLQIVIKVQINIKTKLNLATNVLIMQLTTANHIIDFYIDIVNEVINFCVHAASKWKKTISHISVFIFLFSSFWHNSIALCLYERKLIQFIYLFSSCFFQCTEWKRERQNESKMN